MQIVRNPYVNRSMIRDPDAFFGRQAEVMRLASRLGAESPQSVSIVGERRIGKSSLLSYISHPEIAASYLQEPDRTLFLFIDFQQELRPTIEGFFDTVLKQVGEKLAGRYEPPETADYRGMQRLVEELDTQGYRLVLMLDEFDRVTRSATFDAMFFSFLRGLADKHNIAYITSTGRDLQQLCHTDEIADSPFFNIFTVMHLASLKEAEARELICKPAADSPFPLEPHAEAILELGGCFPFFLQIACSTVFELLVEEGEYSPARVQERFMEEAQPHFQFYWEQMNPVERGLSNSSACGQPVEEAQADFQALVRRGLARADGQLFSAAFAEFVREVYARETGEAPVEVQAERLRSLEDELDVAREMQQSLLPQQGPGVPGLDVAGRCESASEVGGDFYTYLPLGNDGDKLAIIAVDVMGHGMQAAVTALRFSETLRYEIQGRSRATDILGGLNHSLCGTLPAGSFVCCCIGILNAHTRVLDVATAGYHPPLCYDKTHDSVVEVDLGGLPLGINPRAEYNGVELTLSPGDALLFFSDGIIEAQDDRQQEFGETRLREGLADTQREALDAAGSLERLFLDVSRFCSTVSQEDDMTAVVICLQED